MKKSPFVLLALVLASVLCFTVIFPTAASGSDRGPDAIVGARMSMTKHNADSFDVLASAHKGGSISPNVSDSPYGEIVHFTIAPDSGYETASIAVISASGDVLEVTVSEGRYSFVMPAESAVIDVSFQFIRN